MYRFICMLTVKKYACKIVLFFTQCKNKESNVMVLWLYTGCVEILCKLCCKKKNQLFPLSQKNKYQEELYYTCWGELVLFVFVSDNKSLRPDSRGKSGLQFATVMSENAQCARWLQLVSVYLLERT